MYQLRSLRNKMSENELNEDYKEFCNEMERNTAKILDDFFPEDGIEASLANLDLSRIMMQKQVTERQTRCIQKLGDMLFKDRKVVLKNGTRETFRRIEGSTTAALKQWNENFPYLYDLIQGLALDNTRSEIEQEIQDENTLDEKFEREMSLIEDKSDEDGYVQNVTTV